MEVKPHHNTARLATAQAGFFKSHADRCDRRPCCRECDRKNQRKCDTRRSEALEFARELEDYGVQVTGISRPARTELAREVAAALGSL